MPFEFFVEGMGSEKVKTNPDHIFDLGYFIHNYNCGGFNNVILKATGIELCTIFPEILKHDALDGWITTDWKHALVVCQKAIQKYQEYIKVAPDKNDQWYLDALNIIKETIEYVLKKENSDECRISWTE